MTAAGSHAGPRAGAGAVSRADALRAYFELGAEWVAGPARCLGFTWVAPAAPSAAPEVTGESAGRAVAMPAEAMVVPAAGATGPPEPLVFWRPVAADRPREAAAEPAAEEATRRPTTTDLRASGPPPAAPPIVAEARLRRRLDTELRNPRPGRSIDVESLVRRLARGENVRRLPRRLDPAQARLVLVLDPSPRLAPFWQDQLDLALALIRRLGAGRVRRLPPPVAGGSAGSGRPEVDADEIVLAVSDLGFYGRRGDRERWSRFGRRLRAEGAVLRALVPCPAWRWRRSVARLWHAVDWSAPEGAGRRRRPAPLAGAPVAGPVEALLRLLAPAVRVEPGLLRRVRRILGDGADLGTEADVWNHADVDGGSSRVLEIDPRRRLALAAEAFTGWDQDLVAEVARTIVDWHRGRPDLVWASEVAHLSACGVAEAELGAGLVAEAEEVFARAAAGAESPDPAQRQIARGLLAFWRRESGRAPARLPADRRFGPALVRAVRALREVDPEAQLPAGVTPGMLEDQDSDLPVCRYGVWQVADRLFVAPVAAAPAGSLLVEIAARRPVLTLSDGLQPSVELDLAGDGAEVPCPAPAGSLELVTDVETVGLEAWTLPPWATAAGRDGYGLWASFEVGGVEQRLRWLPPGRFLMGSPEDEEGRWSDEGPAHTVVLTEGFWLAETPCTQDLWQAVMGDDNPSYFQSPRRPVEQVSWEDCQRFVDRLDFRFRDLELELPSEAEWEYACRAGTETAIWRGDLKIIGERNAPLLDEIAWYGGNSGVGYDLEKGLDSTGWPEKQHPHTRSGTREVGRKTANPWGLEDMLGNVYEWCWDPWDLYGEDPAVDPEGPYSGARRVIRGGAWDSHARYVRSASRYGSDPGRRDRILGFRLSRGPRDRGAASKEGGRAVSEAARRGTSRARSRRARAWVDRLGWAVDGGLDAYGRWAAFEVESVRHRLRWIYPGRFLMGSPEGEEGRWDDEGPRHEVTLTEGFWLGEVPCTQALWQAVMGENPSHFQSPNRPVERVSWEDCQLFFERLREGIPGMNGHLPTEAQWEYACRAGTEGATWAGALRILGERNAPRLDTIAWYGGNSGVDYDLAEGVDTGDWKEKQHAQDRAGTREVGLKRPNPWGLHDMLGNVHEWCTDAWDWKGYPGGPRVDPVGTDSALRVIRGGAWLSLARLVRSAFRDGRAPGYRDHSLGFRLSRGPEETSQAEPKESGSARRGTRRKA